MKISVDYVVKNLKKLAIITSHPIQYNAPLFKLLASRKKVQIKVFYTWSQAIDKVKDPNFGKTIKWDIPLLDGYDYQIVENISISPGTHHRKGIITPGLVTVINIWKPDAILVYGWNFISHFKVMKYYKGKVPVLFRGDSTLLDDLKVPRTIIRRLFLSWVYRYIDYAFYVGTNNKEYFLRHGLSLEQLILAPHAINNNYFFDSKEKKYELIAKKWRRELGYNDKDIIVLFAGKFEPKKNPEILINAVNKANRLHRCKRIKLLMVGNGVLEEKLKKISVDNLNIKFLAFQNQSKMPILYRIANVFCLPSKGPGETWGLAVNEAMACGRPVLLSDKVGCAADLVKDGYNGWIF